jgi:hypothetical protein
MRIQTNKPIMPPKQSRSRPRRAGVLLLSLLAAPALAETATAPAAPATHSVPGVVVDYRPQASGLYLGSPSLAVLPNGDYLASHDFFGPQSHEHECPTVAVFRSADRGESWKEIARLNCLFWANLFTHRGAVYLMGTDKHHGRIAIRRSTDHGMTWTEPRDATSGLLTPQGQYHTAPVPVVEHEGRLWRAFEDAMGGLLWGMRYRAGMLSVPAHADLLQATNWTFSNFLPRDSNWLNGDFRAWLEGNAVVARDGRIVNLLRVDTPGCPEKMALVNISTDGRTATFDPATGIIDFPGGAKKFTIRPDPRGDLYWSLATLVPPRHQNAGRPGGIRNTLALMASHDLRHWTTRCLLLYHPDTAKHGFQYPDWLFDGDDLIAVVRTAYEDGRGGARNNHDANYLTFHRWKNFRALTLADSVPLPGAVIVETDDFLVTGFGWTLAKLTNGAKAFANRNYVWAEIPPSFAGYDYTQTAGGEHAQIRVRAKREAVLHLAATSAPQGAAAAGWTPVGDARFHYTDRHRTALQVFARPLSASEEIEIPQDNWAGRLVLLPPK